MSEPNPESPASCEQSCLGTSLENTPEAIASNRNLMRVLLSGTVSNLFLLVGGIFFLAFSIREILTQSAMDAVADALYLVATIGFVGSGSIELAIDLIGCRTIRTGRYTSKRRWNIIITVLFLSGVIIDLIAFTFWRTGTMDIPIERTLQWGSSHLWLVASVISLTLMFIEAGGWSGAVETTPDRFDVAGNFFFFAEAVANCVARYITDPNGPMVDYMEFNFEVCASILWILNAMCFLCGDSIRVISFRREIVEQQQQGRGSSSQPLSSSESKV